MDVEVYHEHPSQTRSPQCIVCATWITIENITLKECGLILDEGKWSRCVLEFLQLSHAVRRTSRRSILSFYSAKKAKISAW